jgi:predicted metalloprotease
MTGTRIVGGGLGVVVIVVVAMLFGADPRQVLNLVPTTQQESVEQPIDPAQEELRQFVGVVLADTEDIWGDVFTQQSATYQKPWVVLFSGQVESACGFATAATGPFYCPPDMKVYVDLAFFDELQSRFGVAGDFAVAYVIAHEVGHHVQNQMGLMEKVHGMHGRVSEAEYNRLSVRLELQADFLAGVWAHYAQHRLDVVEPGDFEEALGAAAAVGDDRIQRQTQGTVVPDAFTRDAGAAHCLVPARLRDRRIVAGRHLRPRLRGLVATPPPHRWLTCAGTAV